MEQYKLRDDPWWDNDWLVLPLEDGSDLRLLNPPTDEPWWDGNWLVLPQEDGSSLRLLNPYLSSVKYGNLDYNQDEIATIQVTQRYDHENI